MTRFEVVRCRCVLFAALLALAAASGAFAAQPAGEAAKLQALADEVYAWRLERDPQMRLVKGLPVTHLPGIDGATQRAEADFARKMMPRLAGLDAAALTHAEDLLRLSLQHDLQMAVEAAEFHWLVFAVTPYQGGDIHQLIFRVLGAQQVTTPQQGETYLQLVRDYARILEQMREKTIEQRRRGILLPKPAVPGAVELCRQIRAAAPAQLALPDARTAGMDRAQAARLRTQLAGLIDREVLPRIDRLEAVFDDSYLAAAPASAGVVQYPGGDRFYRHLIRLYTGIDLSAQQIHEIGRRSLQQIDPQLDAIRAQVGYTGSRDQFHEMLQTDPRWLAKTPQEVEARYMAFIERIQPRIGEFFSTLPSAPYGVKRLDVADEPGMTYGFYRQPSAADPKGYYRYNGSGLDRRTLVSAQHLIYHELIPGHHFQIAIEQQRIDAHPLRQFLASTVYVEGWAEYAAALADEMGLYEPYDRYGHLMMQSFIATRLVVDTGMNALGWSLDQARDAMRHGTLEGDAQIASELLRYSTDIPGQALAYYLGYERIRTLRDHAQRELGASFDLRAFNDALLTSGPVPLSVLESHVDWFIREGHKSAARSSAQHVAALNVVTIHIKQPPQRVWAALFERGAWMPSFVSRQHLEGPPGATGDVSLYELRDERGNSARRREEILLAAPSQRLVIRLAPQDGHGTYAIGDYRLTPSGGGTDLEFNVYWWEDVAESATPQHLQRLEDTYSRHTQAKIQADIERLKQFVESGRRAIANP